jgi:CHAD domain-containing protein
MNAQAAWRAVLRSCADHIIVNASQIASGEHLDEHVHQLRVGLRRLRSALSLFDEDDVDTIHEPAHAPSTLEDSTSGGSPQGAPVPAKTTLEDAAAELFRRLGGARDLAVVEGEFAADLVAAMRVAGVSSDAPVAAPASEETPPAEIVRETANQMLLIDLLVALHTTDVLGDTPAGDAEDLRDRLVRRLNRWHRQLTSDAKRFGELDDAARHRLRKRAKRLRYAVEFCASLFERRKVRRYLRKLRALQERLGALSDVVMAMSVFAQTRQTDARAMFALGWLAARRDVLIGAAAPELKAFVKVERFWK